MKLIQKILADDDVILFSDLIVQELKSIGSSQKEFFQIFSKSEKENLRRIHIYREHIQEARGIARRRCVPLGDALHAILARHHNALLVSRDRDFEKLKDLTCARLPEEFI